MKRVAFSFREIVVKFFQPLIKYPIRTLSISVIIGITLYVGIDIVVGELARQNAYDLHMLAGELLLERGPDYAEASKRHADMLWLYARVLEERQLSGVLKLLYPEYSPQRTLAPAVRALKEATSQEEAKEAIWQAGLAINELYMIGKRFPRSPYAWFKSEDVPESLLTDLDNAFDVFHERANELENVQTLDAAREGCRDACQDSRRAILLLSLGRLGYHNEREKIERFLSDVRRARDSALDFATREVYESERRLFRDKAANMDIKASILEAMLDDDMDRAENLLREVVERALKHERGMRFDE